MARDFSGSTSNYLSVGDVSAIDITGANAPLAVSAWVRPDQNSGEAKIVGKFDNVGRQYVLAHTSVPVFVVGDGGTSSNAASGASTISTGAWSHICGTHGSSLRVYLNGTQDGTGTALTIGDTSKPLLFGRDSFGNSPYDGLIAEVAIWAAELSAAEVAALAKGVSPLLIRPGSLRGYWPIWGAGSPEVDLSGNGNNATINGTLNAANHSPTGPYVADAAAGFSTENTVTPTVAVPFISSATTVYAPTLAGSGTATLTVPFISAATTLFAPTIQSSTINVPFIAATTTVYAIAALAGQPMGVSIAFNDPLLEPYPTWTRIG